VRNVAFHESIHLYVTYFEHFKMNLFFTLLCYFIILLAELLQPYKPRPVTMVTTARNMLTSALGLQRTATKEQQEEEKIRLKELRGELIQQ
jgi:hypothetical protein